MCQGLFLIMRNVCSSQTLPNLEFGKNIRVVLDIQSTDSGLAAALQEKNVLVISLGLMRDQTDLAQIALERGFPAVIGNLGNRRLPFPSGVFDAVHCADCGVSWHSRGMFFLPNVSKNAVL